MAGRSPALGARQGASQPCSCQALGCRAGDLATLRPEVPIYQGLTSRLFLPGDGEAQMQGRDFVCTLCRWKRGHLCRSE